MGVDSKKRPSPEVGLGISSVVSCVSARAEGRSHLHTIEAQGPGNQGLFFEQRVPLSGTGSVSMCENQAWVVTPCLVLD